MNAYLERAAAQPIAVTDGVHDVVIIGAGPGGICAAILLRQRGITDVVLLERSNGIGGTWYNNRYPGLACDVPTDLYSYSFFQDFDWSRQFARREEMCSYVEESARRFGVADQISTNVEVTSALWNSADAHWELQTRDGRTVRGRTVVGAVGMFNEPVRPDIAGLDSFAGQMLHTASWPSDDFSFLTGRQVGVIGAAASAIQVVPTIAPIVANLAVFHRTPQWVFPKNDVVFDDETRAARRADPSIVATQRAESTAFVDKLCDYNNSAMMAELREQAMENLTTVANPQLREAFLPVLPIGAQRTLLSSEFYPAFNNDHVHLVTDPIDRVVPAGILTASGTTYPLDVLILATGYAAHKFLSVVDVVGRDNVRLRDLWSEGAYAYKGVAVDGFPNLFMLYGPNTNGGSIMDKLETQSRYVVDKIVHILGRPQASLEVKTEAVQAYNDQLEQDLGRIDAWQVLGSRYFRAPSGRVVTQCPYTPTEYDTLLRADDMNDYIVAERASAAVQ
jgi:cation diffusion facilitator CzcD-associated flavoprotein CzcO